jgi:hypothetical protein
MFTKNVGNADRVVRVAVSLVLALAAYKSAGLLSVGLWVFAGLMMITALSGWCGLYVLLGINTCPIAKPGAAVENKPQ